MGRLTSLSLSLLMSSVVFPVTAVAQFGAEITDEIVVRGVNIPDEKRATSQISNVLSDVKIERSGDSDVAGALRRVTGLSLSQGKFIVVRGLNERYSNLSLNGSPLPSPEPLRRVAPLDLFPTSVVSGILVQKTFSPEFSGEFGGGLIELRSKSLPDEPFFDFKISGSLDLVTTARDGLTFDGGDRDFLGFDDGTRNFPDALEAAFAAQPGVAVNSNNFSEAEIREIGASLPSSELRVIQEKSVPVNHGFNLAGGTSHDLNDTIRVGIVGNLGYGRDFQTKIGRQGDAGVDPSGEVGVRTTEFDFESLTETILLNALIGAGVEIGDDHEVNLTAIYLRKTQKEARERFGVDSATFGDNNDIIRSNLEFFENQVWSGQINTSHFFPSLADLEVTTRVAYSEAFRDAPFETQFTYFREQEDPAIFITPNNEILDFRSALGGLSSGSPSQDGLGIRFSKVEDSSFSGGLDFDLPFTLFDQPHNIKVGYSYLDNERDYILREFAFLNETPDDFTDIEPIFFQRIDVLLSDQNIVENGGFEFAENPDSIQPNGYVGTLEVHGAYVGLDLQLTDFVRASVGVRYETSEQIVDNFRVAAVSANAVADNSFGIPETTIDEDYFLPAVTLTWNVIDNLQARAAFSQTITRPQFQELGASQFTDTDRDITVFGNPFLENTELTNYDLRFEYYFGREQFLTVGGFYKDLENPIEESFIAVGDEINIAYINAPSAELYGVEFEYEQRFFVSDILGKDSRFGQKDLVLSANYTWSQSDVSSDGTVTTPIFNGDNINASVTDASNFVSGGRSLQGQSEHIVNFQLGIEDQDERSRAFFLLNWNSDRIRQVGLIQGEGAVPDVVERLPLTIDFVYAKQFDWNGWRDFELEFKVQNILGDEYSATSDGANGTSVDIDVYDLGQVFSASLSKSF